MSERGQNFDDLKKLLKLKRYEVPPPGFFNHFSEEVVARIRAGESRNADSLLDQLNNQAPWLVSFLRLFEAKPGIVGGFATSLCLLLLFGVVLAERSETGPKNIFTAAADGQATVAAVETSATPQFAANTLPTEGGITISTNASLQPVATLFGQSASASLFQPASFAPAH